MHLKLIHCQVFTREIEHFVSRSAHTVDLESIPMGLHSLGVEMRPHLQDRVDVADSAGYDAILLGYALCGRGTEGLRAGCTQLVLPRAHDCIGVLMGSRHRYAEYFQDHPGVYYRSPGWVEFQTPDLKLEPALPSQKNLMGEQSTLEEFIAKYGEDNGRYLYEQFSSFRRHYSGLTYISTGIASDEACRAQARAEAEKEGWAFEEVPGLAHSPRAPRQRPLGCLRFSRRCAGRANPRHARRRHRGSRMTPINRSQSVRIRLEPLCVELELRVAARSSPASPPTASNSPAAAWANVAAVRCACSPARFPLLKPTPHPHSRSTRPGLASRLPGPC